MIIKSKSGEYYLEFTDGLRFSDGFIKDGKSFFVVDKNVFDLYPELFNKIGEERLFLLNSTEGEKNLSTVQKIIEKINCTPYNRETEIVAVGGGIVGDVAGFTASIIYRGIKWINVPTTLLSCADSCIGGKTGVNFEGYKNLVGSFYPPEKIYISTEILKTLKKEDVISGLGEIFKCSILSGKEKLIKFSKDLDDLKKADKEKLKEYIDLGLSVKKTLIEKDEFDKTGEREKLNLGHTFSHAIEYATDNNIKHGYGVIYGIYIATCISFSRKMLDKETYELIKGIYKKLVVDYKCDINTEKFFSAISLDKKKKDGKLKFLLLDNELKVNETLDVNKEEIENVLTDIFGKNEKIIDEKKLELFNKQKELLDIFLEKGNITKAQYDFSLNGLKTKMGL